jgi:hypothetical protein
MIPKKEELALAVDEAEWSWLRAHLQRGGLVLVDDSIDLAEAGLKVACDDADTIQRWVNSGMMGKPAQSQIQHWDEEKQKKFSMLIVSPYVLIQERMPTFH